MSRKVMQKKTVTKMLIRDAFISLLIEKPLEVITAQEIANIAMVNRSTFYLHYKDKYDLYDSLVSELLKDLHTTLERAGDYTLKVMLEKYYNQNKPLDITVEFLEHIQENASLYSILIVRQDFQVKFANTISDIFYNGSNLPRLVTNHISYSAIGTIMEWLTRDIPYSLNYLAQLLSRFSISIILEYKNIKIE